MLLDRIRFRDVRLGGRGVAARRPFFNVLGGAGLLFCFALEAILFIRRAVLVLFADASEGTSLAMILAVTARAGCAFFFPSALVGTGLTAIAPPEEAVVLSAIFFNFAASDCLFR